MTGKLKLGPILDDKPVRLTVEFAAETHRALVAYAEALGAQTGQGVDPARLVGPMVAKFIASDRGFTRGRRDRTDGTAR